MAAEYIAVQFKSYGLQPASDAGTYLQSVPMVSMKTLPDTTFALIPANGQPRNLRNLDDFVTSNESQTESRSEEHTSELQSQSNLVCRLLLEKKKKIISQTSKCKRGGSSKT